MQCPNCESLSLRNSITTQGIVIEECPKCKGIWFDKGAIYFFTKKPEVVEVMIKHAISKGKAGTRLSPRSKQPMMVIEYPRGPELDYCPQTHGLWLDGGELEKLNNTTEKFQLTKQPAAPQTTTSTGTQNLSEQARKENVGIKKVSAAVASQAFRALPNLAFRSVVTIVGLYGLLTLALITLVTFDCLDNNTALIIGIAFAVIHFALSPLIMDLTLRWMYNLRWIEHSELRSETQQFVQKICDEHGIPFPRFGIIDDGAPQAFTYGHIPSNARVVLSQGTIDLLEQEELEAVIAHEMGHVINWDMLLMTVVQMVPLILYFIYKGLLKSRNYSGNKKGAGARIILGIGAYILYIISEYLVLWFSRTREYHADRFAGIATNKPSALASALVKIAYGLAGKDGKNVDNNEVQVSNLGAMGIFDSNAAKSFAVATYNKNTKGTSVDKSDIKAAMRWDKWNPWAKFYELHSTHPLVANRLEYLSDQSVCMGQEPYIKFDEKKPESYWDEFIVDIFIYTLPIVLPLLVCVLAILLPHPTVGILPSGIIGKLIPNLRLLPVEEFLLGIILPFLGAAMLVKYYFMYPTKFFPEMSVSALLSRVKVSSIRPVPVSIEGTIIGRGVPGYIFSEDFVLQDDTGIIFLDYAQPLFLWDFFFGLLRAKEYHNTEVKITGWYFRAPVPYIRINTLQRSDSGKVTQCWTPKASKLCAFAILAGGMAMLFL